MTALPASAPAEHRASPLDHPWRPAAALALLAALLALPLVAQALNEGFYIGLASRVPIFALAATSLNLILGFGGMVSFGHAAFVGAGGYSVAILMQHGIGSAWIAWPLAVLASAAFALVIGAVSLRTKGVYFIMITLAFAQMLFYVAVSLKAYGGEDGLAMPMRSTIAPGVDMANDLVFYYVVLGTAGLSFAGVQRLLNARFGHALQAIRENGARMAAIGYPVYRHQLAAFTLAGALAGLAGAMAANQAGFVSPSLLQWSQSGMLMIMVILGGMGHLYGGLVGAAVFLLLEEILSAYTIHWQFALGAVLLAVVLAAPNGLAGVVRGRPNR